MAGWFLGATDNLGRFECSLSCRSANCINLMRAEALEECDGEGLSHRAKSTQMIYLLDPVSDGLNAKLFERYGRLASSETGTLDRLRKLLCGQEMRCATYCLCCQVLIRRAV